MPPQLRRSAWKSNCSVSTSRTGRKGGAVLEEAHGGTLFVDDIAELPRETQNGILRVLVDQTSSVGGSTKIAVDVRITSSTARNLEALIAENLRRSLYRLAVVPIRVPPLVERREDIPDLVEYSWIRFRRRQDCPSAGSAMTPWPFCNRITARQCPPVAQQHRAADDPAKEVRRLRTLACTAPDVGRWS
jgi:hypothetical protein